MSESSIFETSDEDSSDGSYSVTVEDSDKDGDDESFCVRKIKKKHTRAIVSDDEDEENDAIDERALSPRTRMSITGIRPKDLDDSSEEVDSSESEIEIGAAGESASSHYKSAEGMIDQIPINVATSTPHVKNALIDEFAVSADTSKESLHSWDAETNKKPELISKSKLEMNKSPCENRYSVKFEHSIKEKLSSTLHHRSEITDLKPRSSEKSDIIELSDSEVEESLITNPPVLIDNKENVRDSANTDRQRHVASAKDIEEQKKYIEERKMELLNAEKLLAEIGKNLPDKGNLLVQRIEKLKEEIELKAGEISTTMAGSKSEDKPKAVIPNWDELSEAVNQIQPKYTGRQGLATFNNQKGLTIDRLKDLHKNLETCPGEDVLAEDPKGLKSNVRLMEHQKHALAWMTWRERQNPRGGILADDMGLGKTLTMISLVLACKNDIEKTSNKQESDDSDDDVESGSKENAGWSTKGRREYYNGGTLVVCPASLLGQWENEVEQKVSRHKLNVLVHHGNNRNVRAKNLKTYDLVITTYNIVARESKVRGAIFGIKWKRIILDEAHIIRNHKAQSSIAACTIRGKNRWALTGTPIQNKEMDMFALLKFLKCSPFDDLTSWKRWIDNKSAGGQQRLNTLIKSLMLRRTKVQLQQKIGGVFSLPEKSTHLIEVNLDKEEMNVYQKVMIFSKTLFAQFLHQRAERDNYFNYASSSDRLTKPNDAFHKMHAKFSKMHHSNKEVKAHEILVLLLRLRQICCHPGLIDSMLEDAERSESFDSSDISHPELDLLDQLNNLAINDDSRECPNTSKNKDMAKASAKVLRKNNPVFDLSQPSSKMRKIFEIVEKNILTTNDKAIIVSQWTSILNILEKHFASKGIRTLSLNGSIPVQKRQDIITEFNKSTSNIKILLLSLTAGGIGLNLVGANNLLMIDLHWNPQLETQAQDRIYRVGQTKKVNVYKFMCKDTIEERIKALQERKLEIANGVLTGVKMSKGSKLTVDDLKILFGV